MREQAANVSDKGSWSASENTLSAITAIETIAEKHFEVDWEDHDAQVNPLSFPNTRKWAVVLLVSATTVCVCVTSSLYASTYDQTTVEFGCSRLVATLGLSLFIAGLGWGPMVIAPLSEFYGRRPIYLISLPMFLIFLVGGAVAPNIESVLIFRFLDGLSGAAFSSVAGGTVGDLFSKQELQTPMFIYTASPFIGASVGPIFGGLINQWLSWRWSFYFLIIWTFVQWMGILFFVPETYKPVLLRDKARRLRRETSEQRWYAPLEKSDRSPTKTVLRSLYRPFMLLVLEPMCLNLCLLSAVLLGIQYLFFGAFGVVFSQIYRFDLWQVGLTFTGMSFGMVLAVCTNPFWQRNYTRLLRQHEDRGGEAGTSEPEYRLPPAIVGAPLVSVGLFWFGWTTYNSIHWIVPILGSVLFGIGMILVFSGVFTFLVDAYPLYAASALGANSFTRSTFAAAFPLFGVQMYNNLGPHWATSVLAAISLVMAPFPYIFYRYGKALRQKSKLATSR